MAFDDDGFLDDYEIKELIDRFESIGKRQTFIL